MKAKQFWKDMNHGKQSIVSLKDHVTEASKGKPALPTPNNTQYPKETDKADAASAKNVAEQLKKK